MVRRWLPAMAVAALMTAACGDATPGDDDVVQRDTMIGTRPDTFLVERTTTVDTINDPDLDRDTLRRDTLRRDTVPR
jgi:hypothetical protein